MQKALKTEEPVNILIVDDHPENLLALEAILENPGYRFFRAESGAAALKASLKFEFAVILLDVMMPGMDGYEVATFLRRREATRHVPIIFLTAIAKDVGEMFRGYSVGAVDYLLKPLDPGIVRAKVAVFVDLFRKNLEIRRQAELLAEKERREREFEVAQLKLAEERRYRELAESIPHVVWRAKNDGTLTYMNKRWAELTGEDAPKSLEAAWMHFMHPEDKKRIAETWAKNFQKGEPFEIEHRILRRSDGKYRWFLCRAIPSRNDAGKVVEWFGTCTDVDTQKRAEFELLDTLRRRDEFLSIAAHELKTPLTSLKLQHEILTRTYMKDPEAAVPARSVLDRLKVVERQIERLSVLVENLLDVTRIRSERLSIEREKIDAVQIVKEVLARLTEQAKQSGTTITLEAESPVVGLFDPVRFDQVVTNLVSNAIKYGRGRPIRVGLEEKGDKAVLVVEDQGIGISDEDKERIFHRFERAVSFRDFGGLGLGLYITHQIVRLHGGTIHVESEVGKGSRFTVELPRSLPTAAKPTEERRSA